MKTYIVRDSLYNEREHDAERIVFDALEGLWLYGPKPEGNHEPFADLIAVYPRGAWLACSVKAPQ